MKAIYQVIDSEYGTIALIRIEFACNETSLSEDQRACIECGIKDAAQTLIDSVLLKNTKVIPLYWEEGNHDIQQ